MLPGMRGGLVDQRAEGWDLVVTRPRSRGVPSATVTVRWSTNGQWECEVIASLLCGGGESSCRIVRDP